MMKLPDFKKLLFIFFLLVLFVLVIEGVYLFGFQRGGARKVDLENKVVRVLPLEAFGRVVKIEGWEITLEDEGDSFSFIVRENTSISRYERPSPEVVTPGKFSFPIVEKMTLEDVKVGDQVFAFLEKTPEAKYVAQTITVHE